MEEGGGVNMRGAASQREQEAHDFVRHMEEASGVNKRDAASQQ
jgi:hypothetical protein